MTPTPSTGLVIQTWLAKLLGLCLIAVTLTAAGSDAKNKKKTPVSKAAKATFDSSCATCHGADGAGTPLGKSLEVADLRSATVQRRPDAELVEAVSNGKGNMPPFKGKLTDEQIQSLIGFVRTLAAGTSAK